MFFGIAPIAPLVPGPWAPKSFAGPRGAEGEGADLDGRVAEIETLLRSERRPRLGLVRGRPVGGRSAAARAGHVAAAPGPP
ncbi:hypothetical protein ABZ260_46050, partial [Streptosporangium sp. NPDC006013]|uniref:hypothetical protein n=1 Tax=Streptosporangium sp. NPDC006013 TaxID=3155596 RepID=UPI0033AEEACE